MTAPITDAQQRELEAALDARERELLAAAARVRESMTEASGSTGPDVLDQGEEGQVNMGLTRELTDLDRAERQIEEIAAARLRMREGTYGYCEDCGIEIPVERLRAVPTARFCVPDEERREKQAALGIV